MQTSTEFDLCPPQDTTAGHPQVLPIAGLQLRKSHNCWSWQDWDLFYLRRQGTRAGNDVSEALGGLASGPSCALPTHLLIWKQVSRAPRKAKGNVLRSRQPRKTATGWDIEGSALP